MAEYASIPISSIPLVVALWEQPNFRGRKRTFVEAKLDPIQPHANIADLTGCNFNDATNAIGIHPGPNFDPNENRTVSFFEDAYFQGDELCLGPGAYSDLLPWGNFGGKISSIAFNAPNSREPGYYRGGNLIGSYKGIIPPPAAQISPIPLVVRLFADNITALDDRTGYPIEAQANSKYLTLVESALDIGAIFGQEFDRAISAVVVQKGPNYAFAHARLCAETLAPGDNGEAVEHLDVFPDQDTEPTQDPSTLIGVAQGVYPALGNPPYNFNDRTRAVLIIEVPVVKPHPLGKVPVVKPHPLGSS